MIHKTAPIRPGVTPESEIQSCRRCVQRVGRRPVVPPGAHPQDEGLTNKILEAQRKLEEK